jgi:folylpolyglutamate synthase/dihydropteroate synthase
MWHTKADAYTKEELFEIKSTEATQMIVHKDWLEKVRNEALKQGKDPVLLLDFGSIIMVGQIRKV